MTLGDSLTVMLLTLLIGVGVLYLIHFEEAPRYLRIQVLSLGWGMYIAALLLYMYGSDSFRDPHDTDASESSSYSVPYIK